MKTKETRLVIDLISAWRNLSRRYTTIWEVIRQILLEVKADFKDEESFNSGFGKSAFLRLTNDDESKEDEFFDASFENVEWERITDVFCILFDVNFED